MKETVQKGPVQVVRQLRLRLQVAVLWKCIDIEPVGLVLVDAQHDRTLLDFAAVDELDGLALQKVVVHDGQERELHDAVVGPTEEVLVGRVEYMLWIQPLGTFDQLRRGAVAAHVLERFRVALDGRLLFQGCPVS